MGVEVIPRIDPDVKHVGVSRLRQLNSRRLRDLKETLVIQDNDEPLAVLLRYEQFLVMQNELESLLETIYTLTNDQDFPGLIEGVKDMNEGRTKSFSDIKASLKRKRQP